MPRARSALISDFIRAPLQTMKTAISSFVTLALAGFSTAYPSILAHLDEQAGSGSLAKRQNTPSFDAAAQYISTSGAYAFVPPGAGDQRGPCPGLNAAANQ